MFAGYVFFFLYVHKLHSPMKSQSLLLSVSIKHWIEEPIKIQKRCWPFSGVNHWFFFKRVYECWRQSRVHCMKFLWSNQARITLCPTYASLSIWNKLFSAGLCCGLSSSQDVCVTDIDMTVGLYTKWLTIIREYTQGTWFGTCIDLSSKKTCHDNKTRHYTVLWTKGNSRRCDSFQNVLKRKKIFILCLIPKWIISVIILIFWKKEGCSSFHVASNWCWWETQR